MWAITLLDFLTYHLLIVVGMCGMICLLWWVFRNQTAKQRFRTSITAPLAVGGYFAGGFVYWILNPTATYQSVANVSMYAMLASQGAGFLISWWVWKNYRPEIEGDEDT